MVRASLHLAERVSLALTAASFAWLMVIWARMVVSPAPQEMREAAPLLTTLAFLAWRNPYALATLPDPANLYGPLYPLIAVPFAWAWGASPVAMRLASASCLVIAGATLYRLCRRQGAARLTALLGTLLGVAGWLYWVGPTVRPDGLGLALMLGGTALFLRAPPSWQGFLPALVLWLLAFATKIYFVFPAFVAAAWTFATGRFRLGLAFAAAAVAGLAATVLGLSLLFPAWAAVVLGASLGATAYDARHLLRQTLDWALFSLPLLAMLAALVVRAGRRPVRPGPIGLLPPGSFPAFAAGCGGLALLASLGGHPGAHMTYFFHLLSPFAIIALTGAAGAADADPWPRRAMILAFPLAIIASADCFPWRIGSFAEAEKDFAEAARLIAAADRPLATTEFAPLLLAAGHRAPETGHSEYFAGALEHPPPGWLQPLWPPRAALAERAEALSAAIGDGLRERRYDLVLTNPFGFGLIPRPLLEAHYRRAGHLPVAMPWASQRWQAEIWHPRDD